MTKRFIVGGPKGSGKSTLMLSLVEQYQLSGLSATALELDLWSDSYRLIRREITNGQRRKRFDLAWPWREALDPLLHRFAHGTEDVIFGDLPGVLGAVNAHVCDRIGRAADGAIIVSRSLEGLTDWERFFRDDYGLKIALRVLSTRDQPPLVMRDMERRTDADDEFVRTIAPMLLP